MSYSFSVHGATKRDVKEQVAAEFNKIVAAQPIHATDRQDANAAVRAFVELLRDDVNKDVSVTVNGSISWEGNDQGLTQANINISASLVPKT